MTKELYDLLVTAAADYRARGDIAKAERFEAYCTGQQPSFKVPDQPSPGREQDCYEEFERTLVQLQNRAAVEPKRVAWELWAIVRRQHDSILCASATAHRKHAAELLTSRGLLRDELESSKARVAELEADLGRFAEGTDIIAGLIASIEKKGNYTAESTINFLNQALGCFNRFG